MTQLAVSKRLNTEWDHRQGDMRTVRLGRTSDAVFVHAAVDYMITEVDLRPPSRRLSSTAARTVPCHEDNGMVEQIIWTASVNPVHG